MPMGEAARGKDILANLQAVATIGAIIVGGVWTYLLFVQQRQRFPHLKMEHKITHVPLPEHRILLLLDVTHSNVGTIKLDFSTADIRIYGLRHPPDLSGNTIDLLNKGGLPGNIEPTAMWTLLAQQPQNLNSDQLFIEPGESDQLHYEFVLSDDVGPLLIYTYYRNPGVQDRNAGWSLRSIYDPRKPSRGDH
jgi:hypothetical protein